MNTIINEPNETDVTYGSAVVPRDHGKNRWALPNGKHTISRNYALEQAKRIDKIIKKNGGCYAGY